MSTNDTTPRELSTREALALAVCAQNLDQIAGGEL